MSISQVYNFDNAANFNLTDTAIDVDKAVLALKDNPGQIFSNDFSSDTGFTYNSSLSEFNAGILRQIDQTPSDSVLGINYSSNANPNWATPTITTNLVNSPTVSGGKLNLNGTNYVTYSSNTGLFSNPYQGCIRFKMTPNYSGAPSSQQRFISIQRISSSSLGGIFLYHLNGSGIIGYDIRDAANTIVASGNLAVWSPTSGTEYEFEFNLDLTTGATRLFIDGLQLGSTISATSSNRQNPRFFTVGAGISGLSPINASFDDVIVFSTPQNTSNYTPGYSVSSFRYEENKIDGPAFSYTGIGTIQSVDSTSFTETGTPRYIVGLRYWDGAAWSISDGSYAQASSSATIAANLASLPVGGSLVPWSVVFPDSNTQSSIDDFEVELTGQIYESEGHLEPAQPIEVKDLVSYSQTQVTDADTDVRLILKVDNQLKYWDGSAWVDSDGSQAQSNTPADFNDNLPAYDLGSNSTVYVRWLLSTSVGNKTPELSLATITYEFGAVETDATTCIVFGYLKDISQNPLGGVKLNFEISFASSKIYKEASNNVISPQNVSAFTDANGYFSIPLIRSSEFEASTEYKVTMFFRAVDNENNTITNKAAGELTFEVPDATTKDITDLLPTPTP